VAQFRRSDRCKRGLVETGQLADELARQRDVIIQFGIGAAQAKKWINLRLALRGFKEAYNLGSSAWRSGPGVRLRKS
jgi:hypothetical protein